MTEVSVGTGQIILIIVNICIALAASILALMVNRLLKSIDGLIESDGKIQDRITLHREDTLSRFATKNDILELKETLTAALSTQENRFMAAVQNITHDRRSR